MDVGVPIDDHEKRLETVDTPAIEWLQEFCAPIEEQTFAEALSTYTGQTDIELPPFDEELDNLGLADEPVTNDGVDRFAYYLQTYEVPIDRNNEGVLLADAKSSAYVDRPVVFHLRMSQDWTHSAPQRPWVDTEQQFERYIGSFQRLLQSGNQRYYLVQDTAGGEPVTLCLYLGDFLEEGFERFSDLDSTEHRRRSRSNNGSSDSESVGIES